MGLIGVIGFIGTPGNTGLPVAGVRVQSYGIGSQPLHVERVVTYPTHNIYYTHVRVLPDHTDRLLACNVIPANIRFCNLTF